MNVIFDNLKDVSENGKINIYAVKNVHKPADESYAISLPSNQNTYFLREYCKAISGYGTLTCVEYDALEHKDNTYESLQLAKIEIVWARLSKLINDAKAMKHINYDEFISGINLTLCELLYSGKTYILGSLQEKSEKTFKGKMPIIAEEGKLKLLPPKNLLTLTLCVDFIVNIENNIVYVFNRKHFEKVFNYYEILKNYVIEKSDIIDDWNFIENAGLIKSQLETVYVYKSLSKIIDDKAYLEKIKSTKPSILKKRLLSKSSGAFTEEDFKGEKLLVNKSNMEKVIKMITKGFKYNFFTDKAED